MVLVTSAEDDGIHVFSSSVFEVASLANDLLQKGLSLESFGPIEAHRA